MTDEETTRSSKTSSENTTADDTSNLSYLSRSTTSQPWRRFSKTVDLTLHKNSLSPEGLNEIARDVLSALLVVRRKNGQLPSKQLEKAICAFFLELNSRTRGLIYRVSIDSTLYFPQGLKARLLSKLDEFNVSIQEREMLSSTIIWTNQAFFETSGSSEEEHT